MLWAIGILLLANWVLGLVSGAALGMWIHLMLVFALIALALAAVNSVSRRRAPRVNGPPNDQLHR